MSLSVNLTGPDNSLPLEVTNYLQIQDLGNINEIVTLQGGAISRTRRLTTTSKTGLILKEAISPPFELFKLEARGLQKLSRHFRSPQVLLVEESFLLLEDLGTFEPSSDYWESFGHTL